MYFGSNRECENLAKVNEGEQLIIFSSSPKQDRRYVSLKGVREIMHNCSILYLRYLTNWGSDLKSSCVYHKPGVIMGGMHYLPDTT